MKASVSLWTLLLVAQLVCQVPALNTARYSQSPVQYHIQADTGGDRYFRYQTYNGQWRKEKRLRNGKVIGAYGWTDDRGILRLYDYLADEHGYRIVRERSMKVSGGAPQNQLPTAEKSDDSGSFSPSLTSRNRNSNPTFSINDIRRKSYEKARKSLDFRNTNEVETSLQPAIADVEEVVTISGSFTDQEVEGGTQSNRVYSESVTEETTGTLSKNLESVHQFGTEHSSGTPSENLASGSQFATEESSGISPENLAREISESTNILGENTKNSQRSVQSDASQKNVRTIQRNINEVAKEFDGKMDNFDRASSLINSHLDINNMIPDNNIARSITNTINTGSEAVDSNSNHLIGNEVEGSTGTYDELRSKRKSKINDLDVTERRRITKGRKLRTFATRQNLSTGVIHEKSVVSGDSLALSNYVSTPRDSDRKGTLSTNSDKDLNNLDSHSVVRLSKKPSRDGEIKNSVDFGSVKEEETSSNVQINSSRPRVSMSRRLRSRQNDSNEPVKRNVVKVRTPIIIPAHRRRNSVSTRPASATSLRTSSAPKSIESSSLKTDKFIVSGPESHSLNNPDGDFRSTTGSRFRQPVNRLKTRPRGLTRFNHQEQILTNASDFLTHPHENVSNSPQGYTLTHEHQLTNLVEQLITSPTHHSLTSTQEQPLTSPNEHTLISPDRHPLTNPEEHPFNHEEHPLTHPEEHPLTSPEEQPLTSPEEQPLTRVYTSPDALLMSLQDQLTSPQLIRQKRKHNRAQSGSQVPKPTINYDTGTMFHFEELTPDGSKKGRHGYVDPLGFLRVTSYVSGAAGHVETRSSRYVGARNAGDPT